MALADNITLAGLFGAVMTAYKFVERYVDSKKEPQQYILQLDPNVSSAIADTHEGVKNIGSDLVELKGGVDDLNTNVVAIVKDVAMVKRKISRAKAAREK